MIRYKNLSTIIEDYIDFTGNKGMLDRTYIKKIGQSVLRKLETPNDLVETITYGEVKDSRARVPDDLERFVQIAVKVDKKVRTTEIGEWTQKLYDGSGCELIVKKDCTEMGGCKDSEVVIEVDRNWELSHPEYKYGHMKHFYRHGGLLADNVVSYYNPQYVLAKPASHYIWNADLFVPGCLNLNETLQSNMAYEFKVDEKFLTFNFREGKFVFSYLAARTDEEGYRMIPDIEEVYEAVKWNVVEAMLNRDVRKATTQQDRNFFAMLLRDAKNEKREAMGRAYELLNTPDFQSWWDFLEQNYFRMFKDTNSVNAFNAKSVDSFNNTMNRLNDFS
jgi:hypothetical protein